MKIINKIINIVLIFCILILIIVIIGYLFFDIVFSFGIMYPSIDIRIELLITGYVVLVLLIGLLILKRLIKNNNK